MHMTLESKLQTLETKPQLLDTKTPPLSFRAKYACRLTREKIFHELLELAERRSLHESESLLPTLEYFLGSTDFPKGPYDLPSMPENKEPSPNPGSFKFCIVGAGVAGLFLAMLLSKAGIPYDLLEASNRVGGRIYTKNLSQMGKQRAHSYYDIGAMRYPEIPLMHRAFLLFDYLGVPLVRYHLDGLGNECPVMYNDVLGPPRDARHFDHYQVSQEKGGVVPNWAVQAGAGNILDQAFKPYIDALKHDFDSGFDLLKSLDMYSTREFLRSKFQYHDPHGEAFTLDFHTIQWLETNNTSSGLFDQAFAESVIDSLDFGYAPNVKWWCIDGGSSKVAEAMVTKIKTQPEIKTTVTRIALKRDRVIESETKVVVDLIGPSGPKTREYDTVFNTTTLACARRMDLTRAELHPAQKDALRTLHYDASSKVAILFKTPWWINICGISRGGTASSDLPLRTCVYPSYNLYDGPNKPAVLLVSYTWAQDAQRIGSLIQPNSPAGEANLRELMLRDLAKLHVRSGVTYEYLLDQYETHHAFDWYHDPYTSGAFALFGPGQFSNLYCFLSRPAADGKLHFVGEASSAHHAWVVGALDSALRAFIYAMTRFGVKELAEKVQSEWHKGEWEKEGWGEGGWGKVGEVECGKNGTAHLQVALGCLKPDKAVLVK